MLETSCSEKKRVSSMTLRHGIACAQVTRGRQHTHTHPHSKEAGWGDGEMRLQRTLALIVAFLATPSWQYVSIELKNGSKSLGDRYKYEDDSVFSYRYANLPKVGKIGGYVWRWETYPNDGCEYIPPLPYTVLDDGSTRWFALIEYVGKCERDMIENVRNAGFDLVLSYTNGSSAQDLSMSLRKRGFPIVAIDSDYVDTLWEVAATDSLLIPTKVEVSVLDLDSLVVGFSSGFFMFFLTVAAVCCIVWCKWRSNRRGGYRIGGVGTDPLNQQYAQARLARQELIENILRQLQELQIEHRQHPPLGEAATQALPQKTFAQARRDSSGQETCAICVEEFQEKDTTRVLPCNHFFHPQCIDPWLTDHSSMCPLCKQSVTGQNDPPVLPVRLSQSGSSLFITDDSSDSTETFLTPTAGTPAAVNLTNSHSPVRQMRGSSVNDDSSSASIDVPLLSNEQSRNT